MKKIVFLFLALSSVALASVPSWSTIIAHRVALVQAQLATQQDQCALAKSLTQLQIDTCAALAANAAIAIDRLNAQPAPSPTP